MSGQGDTMNGETPAAERLSVEQIRELLAKATPGPWAVELTKSPYDDEIGDWEVTADHGAVIVAWVGPETFYHPDACLLAAAPELAERVIEAEAEVERLREALGTIVQLSESAGSARTYAAIDVAAQVFNLPRAALADEGLALVDATGDEEERNGG